MARILQLPRGHLSLDQGNPPRLVRATGLGSLVLSSFFSFLLGNRIRVVTGMDFEAGPSLALWMSAVCIFCHDHWSWSWSSFPHERPSSDFSASAAFAAASSAILALRFCNFRSSGIFNATKDARLSSSVAICSSMGVSRASCA